MIRYQWLAMGVIIPVLLSTGCGGQDGGDRVDVSTFKEFTFSRVIDISQCFSAGDLMNVGLSTQGNNRTFNYTMLTATTDTANACLVTTETGECLIEGEINTRVLTSAENQTIDKLFKEIVVANESDELCGAGNVTLCSDDRYAWDGLQASADFCQPVYLRNAFEVMELLEQLRDGSITQTTSTDTNNTGQFQPTLPTPSQSPVSILRVTPIISSDQLLGISGDYVTIRNQSDLDAVLMQDGSTTIDFENEIALAVIIVRAPCQTFQVTGATQSFLSVTVQTTLESQEGGCLIDLGSIDAYLIVLPKTNKAIQLLLNDSPLEEDTL